jgi:hypothetical protein
MNRVATMEPSVRLSKRHKEKFYPSGWAGYDLAQPGSLRLVPPENRLNALEEDYKKMGVMILDKQPPFGWVLERLNALERDINS